VLDATPVDKEVLALLAARSEVNVNDSGSNTPGRLGCGAEVLGLVSPSLFLELVMLLRSVFAFVLPSRVFSDVVGSNVGAFVLHFSV
jgi:hypothetical protein